MSQWLGHGVAVVGARCRSGWGTVSQWLGHGVAVVGARCRSGWGVGLATEGSWAQTLAELLAGGKCITSRGLHSSEIKPLQR